MNTTRSFILAASISLAMAITFSCSSDDGDGGGEGNPNTPNTPSNPNSLSGTSCSKYESFYFPSQYGEPAGQGTESVDVSFTSASACSFSRVVTGNVLTPSNRSYNCTYIYSSSDRQGVITGGGNTIIFNMASDNRTMTMSSATSLTLNCY